SAAAPPPSPKPAPSASERPAPASLGLDNIDREESKLPAPPKPAPNTATAGVQPSAPPPREGTTLALVWKPTMDRLPASAPEQRDYDVIDFTGLKNVTGRHVRLVTDGGKKVDGIVVSADENAVQLRVGGGAEFSLPRARVLEVELFRPEAPAG
ncbi:MAG TPA: hypothetical protein VFB32_01810, partial [Rudaea sp.]|nr:hypothetical protein [Rudaea sp.]